MEQLLLHLFGDYIVQNDWMALNKKKKGWLGFNACFIHTLTYSLPFLLITNWMAFLVIWFTHFVLDRTKIVDYFIMLKNGEKTIVNFGFAPEKPFVISIWLYIIIDNVIHLLINYAAIKYIVL